MTIEFKNQVDKRAIFLLLGCYCSLPRVMLSKYKTNIEDYPEEFHQTVFGAMFNIASKQNVQKITSLDIENEVSQFDGALQVWNDNNGWEYINKAIEMSKDKLDNIGRYYDDVRKYSIIRNAADNLKIDVSFVYDEDDADIMNNFSTLSSTELLGKINSKFLDFKAQYNNSNDEAYSFKVGDSIRERYTQYKEQIDVWGYPYQSKYLTALSEIQNSFRIELDNLYKENFDKIEEVNKKYNYDLYKSNTSNNVKYNKLLNEKNTELNDIENEFIIKKNYALVTFNEEICKLKESIISEINKEGYKFKEEMMMKYQMQFSGINNKKKVPVSNNVLSARKEWKF